MLTTEDNALLEKRGIDPETVIRQVERFRTGFPYLRIFDSARPGEGITIYKGSVRREHASRAAISKNV